jgi:hypothetical protein
MKSAAKKVVTIKTAPSPIRIAIRVDRFIALTPRQSLCGGWRNVTKPWHKSQPWISAHLGWELRRSAGALSSTSTSMRRYDIGRELSRRVEGYE